MKLTKKLLPALGMLALSACMLVTSTFAWFSMNTKVDVEGLTVSAVGDQVYLQISKHDDDEPGSNFVEGKAQTKYTYGVVEDGANEAANTGALIPTNVYSALTGTTTTSAFDTTKDLVWVTATSADPESHEVDANGYKKITTDWDSYYYKTSYDLRLDPNAGSQDGGKLKVSSIEFATSPTDSIAQSICVLIVCGSNKILYDQTALNTWTPRANSAATLTSGNFPGNGAITTVDIYVFFNGDHSLCKTANVELDSTYAINVSFNVNTDPAPVDPDEGE